jgi:hypothetical protein
MTHLAGSAGKLTVAFDPIEAPWRMRVGTTDQSASSHTFICEGVTIEDEVFIGHDVMFTNELFPRACTPEGAKLGVPKRHRPDHL